MHWVSFLERLLEPKPLKNNVEIRYVPGVDQRYIVDDRGVVWTRRDAAACESAIVFDGSLWRPMAPRPMKNGYCRVTMRGKDYLIHVVVLTSFIGPRPHLHQAAHGNGKRFDNRLVNLRWATVSENHADKIAHGTDVRGSNQWYAKLTDESVMEIRRKYAAGETIEVLAGVFGVGFNQIHKIVSGKQWRHLPVIERIGKSKSGINTSSRFKGVTWNKKRQRWRASIKIDGRDKTTLHKNEEDAARWYDKMARMCHGDRAFQNLPPETAHTP